jgi:predicted phage tail protein
MLNSTITIDRLSEVIAHSTAPSFLLGAVAAFVALMLSRINTVITRVRQLNAIEEADKAHARLKADLPRLERRVRLLHRAIFSGLLSAIAGTVLVILSFLFAFMNVTHVFAASGMFLISLALLGLSLSLFAREIMIALSEYERFG